MKMILVYWNGVGEFEVPEDFSHAEEATDGRPPEGHWFDLWDRPFYNNGQYVGRIDSDAYIREANVEEL